MNKENEHNNIGDVPLTADGFDGCFIGYFQRVGGLHLAVYDYELCVESLVKEGLSWEDAIEHMEFNVVGGWVGEGTPAFVHKVPIEDFRALAGEYYA